MMWWIIPSVIGVLLFFHIEQETKAKPSFNNVNLYVLPGWQEKTQGLQREK